MRVIARLVCILSLAPVAFAQGPVARWPMDEGQGQVTTDQVGGLQLKLEGATWTETKLGPALSFDGENARAICDFAETLKPTRALSIAIWARRTALDNYQMLVDAGSGWGDDNQGYRLLMYGRHLRFMLEAGGDACNPQGGEIVLCQWHHFAMTYDGAQVLLYQDGKQVAAKQDSGEISYEGLKSFLVGNGGNGGITGDIDDLAIYDRALNGDEIAGLFEQGKGRLLDAEELMAELVASQEAAEVAQVPEEPFTRDRHTCLLASFDSPQSNDADYARRDMRAAGGPTDCDVPGKFGLATRLRDGGIPIIYAGASNCDMRQGTIEFWVRSPDEHNIWADESLYVMLCVYCEDHVGYPGRPGFNLILRKLGEPRAIELSVDRERRGWYSHIRPEHSAGAARSKLLIPCAELDPGAWHHVAVSWDSAEGGTAYLFVDGKGVTKRFEPPLGDGLVIPCKKVYLGGGYFADLTPELDAAVDELRITDQCVTRSRLKGSAPDSAPAEVEQKMLMRAEDLVRAWLDTAISLQIGGGWQTIFDWPILTSTESPGTYSILAEDEQTARHTVTAMLRGYEVLGDQRYLRSALMAGEMLMAVQDEAGAWCQGYIVAPHGYEPVAPGRGAIEEGTQQDPIRFLCYLYRVTGDERYLEAAKRGGEFVIAAQNADGSWPLGFNSITMSAGGGYGGYSTLNDGTTIWGMRTMLLVHQMTGERKFLDALLRAGEFLVNAQLPPPTYSWAEQYGPDGKPAWARQWEAPHACTTAVGYARQGLTLMYDLTGDEKYLEPLTTCLEFWADLPKEHDGYQYYDMQTGVPIDAHGYKIYYLGDPEFGKMRYLHGTNPAASLRGALTVRVNGPVVPLRTGLVPRVEFAPASDLDPQGLRDPLRALTRVQTRALSGINALDAWNKGELDGAGRILVTSKRSGPLLNLGYGSRSALDVLSYIQAARAALGDIPVSSLPIWANAEYAHVDPQRDWYKTPLLPRQDAGLIVRPSKREIRLAGNTERLELTLTNVGPDRISVTVQVSDLPAGVNARAEPRTIALAAGTSGQVTVELAAGEQPGAGVAEIHLRSEGGARVLRLPVSTAPAGLAFTAEAEEATRLEAPFARLEDASASGGLCVGGERAADFTPDPVQPDTDDGGAAIFEFQLTEAGRYPLALRAYWLDTAGNSLYARMDGGEDEIVGNDPNFLTWQWVSGPTYELSAGKHTLRIGNRETGARLDRVYLGPRQTA